MLCGKIIAIPGQASSRQLAGDHTLDALKAKDYGDLVGEKAGQDPAGSHRETNPNE